MEAGKTAWNYIDQKTLTFKIKVMNNEDIKARIQAIQL